MKKGLLLLFILMMLFGCHPKMIIKGPKYDYSHMEKRIVQIHKKIERFVYAAVTTERPLALPPATRIDSIIIDDQKQMVRIDFSKHFSFTPLREENVTQVYKEIRALLSKKYSRYQLLIRSLGYPIQDLIPNFFRSDKKNYDFSRMPKKNAKRPLPVVRRLNGWEAPNGLQGKNIVLWQSHGWYYNQTSRRWEWQRPRLFQTVEDLLPTSFTIPYLIPMLENAGANVFDPRERDIQSHEVVVDNDSTMPAGKNYSEWNKDNGHFWQSGPDSSGFGRGNPPYPNDLNPFRQGSYRQTLSDTLVSAAAVWTPDIPESGQYAVYISFHASKKNAVDAHYTVYHQGGQTRYLVNQQIGGGSWVYLGRFFFKKGLHADSGSVRLSNLSSRAGQIISADAVRFGGGTGLIRRGCCASGRPRFEEAARYNLQYSGMPDTLVYDLNMGQNDYADDYQCRAEYANYLKGAPYGPNKDRLVPGLGIPIDLSLAFHTDAGISKSDSTIGTLSIYSIVGADTQQVFPDSVSRLASRDFADLLQTQIVDDIRAKFDPSWNRRSLLDAEYSEVYRPNMPAALIELLSHQNFSDMRFAMDPRFRFTVARAMYKAMLKFLATEYNYAYVVQPLPVTHFSAVFDSSGNLLLQWKAQNDSLEPTAKPEKYKIYIRRGQAAFTEVKTVEHPKAVFSNLTKGIIYSFKVTAFNTGGESFPSEILAVCSKPDSSKPVLVVNGFDRVGPPAIINRPGYSGFWNSRDNGVPDRYDVSFTGAQINFDNTAPFRTNDAPGHGASYADFETRVIPGNTFDFTYLHGLSIKQAGYSFVSCSKDAVMDGLVNLRNYPVVDLILGEEKTSRWQNVLLDTLKGPAFKTFPVRFQKEIKSFTRHGGNLFVSGAYVGTDLVRGKDPKDPDVKFAENILHFVWVTNYAARRGTVFWTDDSLLAGQGTLKFNQRYNPHIYTVEAPDAINPAWKAHTILRYDENGFGAGVAYSGKNRTVVLGFPFESILKRRQRDDLMARVLKFLDGQ